MMPARKQTMTYAEYFAFEERTAEKHEFLNGEVFAMGGGTIEHARLIAGVSIALGNALRGLPCCVYSSELRIRIRATGLTTYPDVSVVCGKAEADAEDPHAIVNPALVVRGAVRLDGGVRPGREGRPLPALAEPARVRARLAAPATHRGLSKERRRSLGALRVRERQHGGAHVRRVLHRRGRGVPRSAGGSGCARTLKDAPRRRRPSLDASTSFTTQSA